MSDMIIPKMPTQSVSVSSGSTQVGNNDRGNTVTSVSKSQTLTVNTDVQMQSTNQQPTEFDTGNSNVSISQMSPNIMTYRDSESGRLVVKLVDENNNAVISEFPSKTMLGNYPKQLNLPSSESSGLDTKA